MKQHITSVLIAFVLLIMILPGCGSPQEPAGNVLQPPTAAVSAKTKESDTFFQQGLHDYEQYQYRQAVANFDKAIAADPDNFKVYTAKGIALCFEGNYKDGMAMIQKTLDMNPGYVPAFYDMAMAYKLQDNYDQALFWFEKTLQGDPANTWSYYGIATIHADRNNVQEALKYLKKAIELDSAVKAVAQEQDHFEKMRSLTEFKALVR